MIFKLGLGWLNLFMGHEILVVHRQGYGLITGKKYGIQLQSRIRIRLK